MNSPSDIGIWSFAPTTSVEIERLFSSAFLANRTIILDETANKIMFIKYNSLRFKDSALFVLTPKRPPLLAEIS